MRLISITGRLHEDSHELFDTYRPNDQRPKLFPLLNKAATSGEQLDMSAGEQLIDLVHVDDVTEANVIGAQRLFGWEVSQHERHAVSSGRPLPLKDLVQLYAEVTKQTIPVSWGAGPSRYREMMAPWHSGEFLLCWVPSIELDTGLTTLLQKVGRCS
jgi:nucleoside-diphosphate-sugar epimerase